MKLKDPRNITIPEPKRYKDRWRTLISYGWDDRGKRLRKAIYGVSKRECQSRANTFVRSLLEGFRPDQEKTFADVLAEWLVEKEGEIAPSSLRRYRQEFDNILPIIGGVRLSDLDPDDIRRVKARLEAISPRAVNQGLGRLRQVMRYALAMGYTTRNPADPLVVKGATYRPSVARVWSREEIAAFLRTAEGYSVYPLFRLALETGLRPGEALGLKWDALDGEYLEVKRTVESAAWRPKIVERVKTHYANRTLRLVPELVELLHAQRSDDAVIFPGQLRDGNTPLNSSYVLKRLHWLAAQAGVPPIRLHDLRHTYASLYIETMFRQQRFDLAHFSRRIMGHSTVSFTLDRYGHVIERFEDRPAVGLSDLLDG